MSSSPRSGSDRAAPQIFRRIALLLEGLSVTLGPSFVEPVRYSIPLLRPPIDPSRRWPEQMEQRDHTGVAVARRRTIPRAVRRGAGSIVSRLSKARDTRALRVWRRRKSPRTSRSGRNERSCSCAARRGCPPPESRVYAGEARWLSETGARAERTQAGASHLPGGGCSSIRSAVSSRCGPPSPPGAP